MLKYALLAGAMALSAPALAQDAAPGGAPMAQTPPAAAISPANPQPAKPAVASEAQVATVVEAEFPAYDKNADGTLDDAEFTTWMTALRKASEPSLDVASAEVAAWIDGAFAKADADKNAAVTKAELTGFLSAGQPS